MLENVDIDPGVGKQGAHGVNTGGAELGTDLSAKSIEFRKWL